MGHFPSNRIMEFLEIYKQQMYCRIEFSFLGGKRTVSFFMSISPLLLDGFSWNFIFEFLFNLSWRNKFRYNLTRITGTLHEDKLNLWQSLAELFLEWEVFQTNIVEKIKTNILCSITFFRNSRRLWDNAGKYGWAGQAADEYITRRKGFAWWVAKNTNTNSEYAIPTVFPHQQWLRGPPHVMIYIRCMSLFIFFPCILICNN
jgi:hypothetical protein